MSKNDFSVTHAVQIWHVDDFGYQIQTDETGSAVEILYCEDNFKNFKTIGVNLLMQKDLALAVSDAIREIASKLTP